MNVGVMTVLQRSDVLDGVEAIKLHLFWSFLIITFRFGE